MADRYHSSFSFFYIFLLQFLLIKYTLFLFYLYCLHFFQIISAFFSSNFKRILFISLSHSLEDPSTLLHFLKLHLLSAYFTSFSIFLHCFTHFNIFPHFYTFFKPFYTFFRKLFVFELFQSEFNHAAILLVTAYQIFFTENVFSYFKSICRRSLIFLFPPFIL